MDDRCKKNIRLKNPTRYFDPSKTKTMVEVHSPNSYESQRSKIEGYETRLYYEFKYCDEHNGQTYFYTLTYNDKNIPKYFGKNCFDYKDLRDLLNGAFTKYLLRHYGTKMKYFVGAELGDGKGVRGWHNNPHYHILFFLRPANDDRYPYVKIDPYEFRSLIRLYWQGYDQGNKYSDFQDAKKGMVKEGDNLGLVMDFRAISYVSKYVIKDVGLVSREKQISYILKNKLFDDYYLTPQSKFDFYDYLSKFNLTNPGFDDVESLVDYYIGPEGYLGDIYLKFVKDQVDVQVKEKINEYRNRYCNKCRISQGVGEYALDFIEDELDPSVPVATKNGIKNRTLNLYYYRKLYCDKVKDDKGNTMYVLNQKGIDYKVAKLPKQIEQLTSRTWSNLQYIRSEEDYNNMYYSSINNTCWMKYNEFQDFINTSREYKNKVIKRYAEYKLVYEDRFLEVQEDGFSSLDPVSDYRTFIIPIVDKVEPDKFALTMFLEGNSQGYLAYWAHPYFLQYHRYFSLFDTLSDYSFIKMDNKKEKEAKEIAETRRVHLGRQYQY